MAPTTAPSAAAGPGVGLPSLTSQVGGAAPGAAAPGAGQVGTGQAAAPGAAAPGAPTGATPAAPAFDMDSVLKHGQWFGPVMAVGGGIAAALAFAKGQDGSKFLKWGGTTAALSGLALTYTGSKAAGRIDGTKATETQAVAAINQLNTQYESTMQALTSEAQTRIGTLEEQLQAAKAGGQGGQPAPTGTGAGTGTGQPGAVDPTTGQPIPGGQTPTGVGLGSTVVPTTTTPTTPTTPGTQGTTAPGGTTPAGPWSLQSVIGTTVSLQPGASASGTVIADGGNYRIEQAAGSPEGYATLDEANAAARSTMSTELMGSKFLRWMVVEHEGRFYGAIAKQMGPQDPANPISPKVGNVVAWSALNHVADNGKNGWQAYSWSQTGGAQSMTVPYGTTSVFTAGGVGVGTAGTTTTGGGPAAPTSTAPTTITATGGGAPVVAPTTSGAPFDPASQVGRTFSVNAANTAEGDLARGGTLQVQKFVDTSTGGFGTAEEAATAARVARSAAGGGNQWQRWVSLQGSDGRFYVYEGSIVKRETAALQGAAPMHVFGASFAEYFDGTTSSWRAVRDAA